MERLLRVITASICLQLALGYPGAAAQVPASDGSRDSINARADYLRINREYVPPPGEALHHYTSGYAKILCSAIFVTGWTQKTLRLTWAGLFPRLTNELMSRAALLTEFDRR